MNICAIIIVCGLNSRAIGVIPCDLNLKAGHSTHTRSSVHFERNCRTSSQSNARVSNVFRSMLRGARSSSRISNKSCQEEQQKKQLQFKCAVARVFIAAHCVHATAKCAREVSLDFCQLASLVLVILGIPSIPWPNWKSMHFSGARTTQYTHDDESKID